MSKFSVHRLNSSPYQGEDFFQREKDALTRLGIENYCYQQTQDFSENSILITNTHTELQQISPEKLKNIKLIIHPNSGHDNLMPAIEGITCPIIVGNSIRAQAVVNYIHSALFNHYTPLPQHKEWSKQRTWNRKTLSELNILIIGYGHIGKILEKSLAPLVNSIYIHDPDQGRVVNLKNIEVFDSIVLAASLTKSSHHIVNQDFLSRAKRDLLLINPARGGLVKLEHLLDFLSLNQKAYAYLDVFEEEPFNLEKLAQLPNINSTSHIAGVFKSLPQKIIDFIEDIVDNFINLESSEFKNKFKNINING